MDLKASKVEYFRALKPFNLPVNASKLVTGTYIIIFGMFSLLILKASICFQEEQEIYKSLLLILMPHHQSEAQFCC